MSADTDFELGQIGNELERIADAVVDTASAGWFPPSPAQIFLNGTQGRTLSIQGSIDQWKESLKIALALQEFENKRRRDEAMSRVQQANQASE